jgi:hypothetical protein
VAELLALAEAADAVDVPDGMSVPEELARREERLARIAEAKTKIEVRAKARFAREQAHHEATLKARQEKEETTGKKPGGRPPAPPQPGPGASDQVNLTDEDSRIMPVAGGGFEQACNAHAVVAEGSLLVVASDVTHDDSQVGPSSRAGDPGVSPARPKFRSTVGGRFRSDRCRGRATTPLRCRCGEDRDGAAGRAGRRTRH